MSGFEETQAAVSDATAQLRDTISASTELTVRLSHRLGMHSTDVQALYLLETTGPLGVAELARELGMKGASATALVDRLERAGHAVRERDPQDRRRVWVSTTPAAMEALLPVWSPKIARIDAVARSLSAKDRETVVRYLGRVAAAMREPD